MTFPGRKFIAWHPVLTDHQAFTYQELSRQSGCQVIAYVARQEDPIRKQQGWTNTQVEGIERRVIPSSGKLLYCLRELLSNRHDIHIFGSAFEQLPMMLCLYMAACLGVKLYIVSEPYSPVPLGYLTDRAGMAERIKARLRPLAYRLYVLGLRRRLQGIFAISSLAIKQYETAGMPRQKVYPFGYFVPGIKWSSEYPVATEAPQASLRLVFVGSLIGIKGLHTLVDAVHRALAQGLHIELDIFGPGDPSAFSIDGKHIRYCGRIPFGQTQQRLVGYDLLVLPSHYDGWGVVVNEALCAGVPVLCSDQVGARVLAESFGAGRVFPRGDASALATVLADLAREPENLLSMKRACQGAANAIQPAKAASYMLDVISAPEGEKASIPSPWYRPVP